MAISQEDFIAKSGAELIGGRLVVGVGPHRRYVGTTEEGAFSLNDAGKEIAAVIEEGGDAAAIAAVVHRTAEEEDKPEADAASEKKVGGKKK